MEIEATVASLLRGALDSRIGFFCLLFVLKLGAVKFAHHIYDAFRIVYVYFFRSGVNVKEFGPWAVVTGATDGIGKAYCVELAKKGVKLVLISRSEAKLSAVAEELHSEFGVECKYVAADLTKDDDNKWKEIKELLGPLEVGLLLNNAGMSYDHFEFTDLLDEKQMEDLITINVTSLTKMCQIVLPGMKSRQRGYIVNMGSASGLIPACPFLSVYAGTKAYVNALSRSMDVEYRKFNIKVQNQAPFFVATRLAKIRRASLSVPSPATYAQAGLRHIGYEATSICYWVHAVIFYIAWAVPHWLFDAQIYNMHDNLRLRYLKKLEATRKEQ